KLDDICADYVADMSGEEILEAVRTWALTHDAELARVVDQDREVARRALAIERGPDVANPRKDLKKWADFRTVYGYFFPALFQPAFETAATIVEPEVSGALLIDLAETYQEIADGQEWFQQLRDLAGRHGFAQSPKELKAAPDKYKGSIREVAQVVRVALTGS